MIRFACDEQPRLRGRLTVPSRPDYGLAAASRFRELEFI